MHFALLALIFLPALSLLALVVYLNLPHVRRVNRILKNYPTFGGALPIFGDLLYLIRRKDDLFWVGRELYQTLGSRYVTNNLGVKSVNVCDPDAAEAVLSSSVNIQKGRHYRYLSPWLGQGLLTSSGSRWHSHRKLLTPAFHFRILGQFSEHLEQQAQELVDDLTVVADGEGAPINVVPLFSRATLKSIRVTAMGEVDFQTAAFKDGEDSYFKAIHRVGNAIVYRINRPWLWPSWGFTLLSSLGPTFYKDLRFLHSFSEKVIAQRKSSLLLGEEQAVSEEIFSEAAPTKKKNIRPFLDVLLSVQKGESTLTDRDIREEVDTFMFEGHDTTSVALCWALELLGRHPAEQEALAREVLAAPAHWDSVSRLLYLDRVLKECLRLRPSVPFISRFLTADITLRDGQVMPRDSGVNVHIYDLHRNPEHFPDPERFDPDRFLPEKEQARHPFAYIPFSAGPTNCIGKKFAQMEVKLFLSAVVRNFVIRSAMPEKLDVVADLVLRPRDGVLLYLTPRSNETL